MNFLKKVNSSPKLKRIKARRAKLDRDIKALSRERERTFKAEARRIAKKDKPKRKKPVKTRSKRSRRY